MRVLCMDEIMLIKMTGLQGNYAYNMLQEEANSKAMQAMIIPRVCKQGIKI